VNIPAMRPRAVLSSSHVQGSRLSTCLNVRNRGLVGRQGACMSSQTETSAAAWDKAAWMKVCLCTYVCDACMYAAACNQAGCMKVCLCVCMFLCVCACVSMCVCMLLLGIRPLGSKCACVLYVSRTRFL
jgi:hypothetical protein